MTHSSGLPSRSRNQQRVWNRQPAGGAAGEGTSPKIIGNYDLNTPEGWAKGRDGAFAVSRGAVGIKALEPAHQPGGIQVDRSAMLGTLT